MAPSVYEWAKAPRAKSGERYNAKGAKSNVRRFIGLS
jgi:hypothetical protein